MGQWMVDSVGPGFGQAILVDGVLYDHRSLYHHVQVATSPIFGRMLILDDAVQTTEADEHVYHEMLAHLPLVTHPRPERVVIIGGGDGGTLEEVLKHPLDQVTMVEIDREVVDVSRRYLPAISGTAFEDPRTRLLIDDGIAFVQATPERFDAILVDSTDPKGPGVALFSEEFYRACARALTDDGLVVAQSGSLHYQQELTEVVRRHLSAVFPIVVTYWAPIPAYPGVLWTFTCGSTRSDPRRIAPAQITRRMEGIPTRYYTPAVHESALQPAG